MRRDYYSLENEGRVHSVPNISECVEYANTFSNDNFAGDPRDTPAFTPAYSELADVRPKARLCLSFWGYEIAFTRSSASFQRSDFPGGFHTGLDSVESADGRPDAPLSLLPPTRAPCRLNMCTNLRAVTWYGPTITWPVHTKRQQLDDTLSAPAGSPPPPAKANPTSISCSTIMRLCRYVLVHSR